MSTNKLTLENINEVLQKDIIIATNNRGYKITYNPYDLRYKVWHWSLLTYHGDNPKIALNVYNPDEDEDCQLMKETLNEMAHYILNRY